MRFKCIPLYHVQLPLISCMWYKSLHCKFLATLAGLSRHVYTVNNKSAFVEVAGCIFILVERIRSTCITQQGSQPKSWRTHFLHWEPSTCDIPDCTCSRASLSQTRLSEQIPCFLELNSISLGYTFSFVTNCQLSQTLTSWTIFHFP